MKRVFEERSGVREGEEGSSTRRRFVRTGIAAAGLLAIGAMLGGVVIPHLTRSPLERARKALEETLTGEGFFVVTMQGCGPCEALKRDLQQMDLPFTKRIYTLKREDIISLLQGADKRWGGFPRDFVPTVVVRPYGDGVLIAQGYDARTGDLIRVGGERISLMALRTGSRMPPRFRDPTRPSGPRPARPNPDN